MFNLLGGVIWIGAALTAFFAPPLTPVFLLAMVAFLLCHHATGAGR